MKDERNPTLYLCEKNCGAKVMSATSDKVLMRLDRALSKQIENKCSCGGSYKPAGPLHVFDFTDLIRVQIHCKPCKVLFKRVTPARFSCPGCSEIALVNEKSLFFFPTANVAIDYK